MVMFMRTTIAVKRMQVHHQSGRTELRRTLRPLRNIHLVFPFLFSCFDNKKPAQGGSCCYALQHKNTARVCVSQLAQCLSQSIETQQPDVANFTLAALYGDSV
jgi:hypothetical protein